MSALLGRASSAESASEIFERWKLGVITDQVGFDLRRVLSSFYLKYPLHWAEIRYLRLRGETRYVYFDATPQELKQVRSELDSAGVRLSVLDSAIYKNALPGTNPMGERPAYVDPAHETLSRQLEDLKLAADAAHALGTNRVRIFTFRRVADPHAIYERVLEQVQKAVTVAKQHDIVLLVENEYDTNTATGAEIARLFKAIPDRRLMHNWDPCNSYESGEQPFPAVWNQIDHSRISHIHLKDAEGKEWKPIGSGKIDFAGQFRALKNIGYTGTMSLETRYRDAEQDAYRSSVESMDGLVRFLESGARTLRRSEIQLLLSRVR
ncbi:MAG TPA: sugar phosphate isomerase/epimerase family protein [Bryobacteraceae bacterium]|nr:sugar phosphate isomerase/epimerase family protein [Bryobacteraceae bacterium]